MNNNIKPFDLLNNNQSNSINKGNNDKYIKNTINSSIEHNSCPLCKNSGTMQRVVVRELKDRNKTKIMGYYCKEHRVCIPDF